MATSGAFVAPISLAVSQKQKAKDNTSLTDGMWDFYTDGVIPEELLSENLSLHGVVCS